MENILSYYGVSVIKATFKNISVNCHIIAVRFTVRGNQSNQRNPTDQQNMFM